MLEGHNLQLWRLCILFTGTYANVIYPLKRLCSALEFDELVWEILSFNCSLYLDCMESLEMYLVRFVIISLPKITFLLK